MLLGVTMEAKKISFFPKLKTLIFYSTKEIKKLKLTKINQKWKLKTWITFKLTTNSYF